MRATPPFHNGLQINGQFGPVGGASGFSEGAGSVGSYSSESTTQLDYSRLKAEHRKLQRHFEVRMTSSTVIAVQNMRLDRYRAPEIEETTRRLLRGEATVLELYRTKREKLALLDAAIECADGNAIIAVGLGDCD